MTERTGRTESPGGLYMLARGSSMGSRFPQNAILRIQPVEPGEVRLGDLLVFETPSGRVCHRVLAIFREGFWCVGDAHYSGDRVAPHAVLGRVTSINGRPILNWPARLLSRSRALWRRWVCTMRRAVRASPAERMLQWWIAHGQRKDGGAR